MDAGMPKGLTVRWLSFFSMRVARIGNGCQRPAPGCAAPEALTYRLDAAVGIGGNAPSSAQEAAGKKTSA